MEKELAKRILIVEDDTRLRFLLTEALSGAGFQVDNSIHGRDALKKLESIDYDLVITDINMPLIDGVELYRHTLDRTPNFRDRFLFITGDPPVVDRAGLDDRKRVLVKPFKVLELLERVNSIFENTPGQEMHKYISEDLDK